MTNELISEALRWANGHPNRRSSELMRALADALESRQPGENDREATEAEIDKAARALHMAKCCSLSGDSPHDFPEASEVFAAGVVLNAVPRAAVPDAATEAERDAALAAIERVTRAKLEVDSVHQFHGNDCLCGFSSARSRSRTEHITGALLAALDGAPEPEGRWEYRVTLKNGVELARGTLDEVRRFKTIDIERRRLAGPWLPVEGEKP